jgi:hypothetical protein
MDHNRRNLIAQWAFDTKSILGRFHLWLEDVEERWIEGGPREELSFVGAHLEKNFIMTAAVTALGTRLFGRYGEGKGQPKASLNRIKKDADAVSAYAMSEALWFLTRRLPEKHAVMVSLGEGLMPKAGETPEQGSNPLLGFGRVYARPEVARHLDRIVRKLINEKGYGWDAFWKEVQSAGITIWGAAIDTLENTSRFAKGDETGPMTVLHLFDQPLMVTRPYEGYMGYLALPRAVVETAANRSVLLNYRTPRALVLEAIEATYPDIRPERVHVWTLGGKAREPRIGSLWKEWRDLGAHLVEEGWTLPGGGQAFTESGTYAPTARIGSFEDGEGRTHVFLCDGYAATAEAIQAASLDPVLDVQTSMCVFSSRFDAPWERERDLMRLDPAADGFEGFLSRTLGREVTTGDVDAYRSILLDARDAAMPLDKPTVTVDDFFPNKRWRVLALAGYMLPDPYSGARGVEETMPQSYRVTTTAATRSGLLEVTLQLRLLETREQSRLVFSPLLDRFFAGEDFRRRPVKISDSGRIRNEIQTWCSWALESFGDGGIRIHFDRIDDEVVPRDKQDLIREVLAWYKENHPIWFRWLEID